MVNILNNLETKKRIKPFLRWAGGKTHLIDKLIQFVPKDFKEKVYREPFLGGGAMFFALRPSKAILSDLNPHLINCYKMVRDHPKLVYLYISQYANQHSLAFYYRIRDEYNKSKFSIKQAARFIYLNKTSFNGIFRVNKRGEFNVPYGKKDKPALPTLDQLESISCILKNAMLTTSSYEEILKDAKKDEFIYLDPPYPPLNGTAYFTHYTKERFGEDDQLKLFKTANKLIKRNCLVMISNADTLDIRNLYKNWNIYSIPVTRWITCKTKKHKVNELVITNYKFKGESHV